ncbi:hypothetical protein GCM10010191_74430 [Actinomadura vinacea]|uniref:Uncharacterized protein n=1 Tax=Actinomadura vinacea TaxID=115336 RepID=A0ABN3K4R6_9ACTN
MFKYVFLIGVLAVVGAVVLVLVADVPLAVVLSLGAGALCLAWLVVLLTVPWNVYFQARRVIGEIRTSRERGLEAPQGREEEARRIAVRVRAAAVGAHVLSAALAAVITYFSGAVVGYYFVGFYLVSTFFRPVHAWFVHLRERLGTMLRETRHPRDDVLAVKERLTLLEFRAEQLRQTTEQLHEADLAQGRRLDDFDLAVSQLHRRLDALGRRFEDTVAQLTDDQEVISGIRAFLRLLRAEPTV